MNRKNSGKMRLNIFTVAIGGIGVAGIAMASFSTAVDGAKQNGRKSTEAPIASRGKLCNELFLAIDHRDTKGVEELLAKGADPNGRNGLEFTPIYIAAASHQPDVVTALLKAGAQPDAISNYGTPLLFASATGNVPDAMRFLELGAKPDVLRNDGMSPMMMATNSGVTPLVAEFIKRKVDVNVQDDGGSSALSYAAKNGFAEIAGMLLAAGAKIDMADVEGLTPLMAAALNNHADVVKLLIEKGANPNAKDNLGNTALIMTAAYGDSPEAIKALIDGKADTAAKDAKGRTAAQLAASRGYTQTAMLLSGGSMTTAAVKPSRSSKEAVSLSLKAIQSSMRSFSEAATCISCHQEGLGRITTGEAQDRGFKLDQDVQETQMGRVNGMVTALKPLHEQALKNPEAMKQLPLIEINEISPIDGWLMAGMAAQKQAPNAATAAMAMCFARQQSPDGCWTFSLPRVPMQSSFFTFTALAAKALTTYGPKSEKAEIDQRLAKAKDWFMTAKPQNSEDRASKLLGLKWTGADAKVRQEAVAEILADQKGNGGWAQYLGQSCDSYATGQALYALRVGGGMSVDDPAYQRGVQFLLMTQDDDGTWFVSKRALPVNNYFDAGFPHGQSQYSSFNGTCWATLALLPTIK